MKITRLVSPTLLSLVVLLGCSNLSPNNGLDVSFSKNAKLVYKGNSAAMMSMIGTMGIAIGVAIDEGIGKEIEAGLGSKGGSKAILSDCLLTQSRQNTTNNVTEITIQQIAIVPKDEGYYVALGGYLMRRNKQTTFNIGQREWGMSANLTELKTNPELAINLLEGACKGLADSL